MIHLRDKIIVVTGGNGLIGGAYVRAVREAGGTCINADISAKNDLDAGEWSLDITSEESVKACIQAVVAKFGRLDGWVNNAYPRTKDWGARQEDVPMESWRLNVDWHLNGYYLCCKEALAVMKEQKFGSLINIGSTYGVVAPDFTIYEGTPLTSPVGYAAIKGGILQLSRYLASYYGEYNVRVNSLCPGGIFDNQNPIFVENYEKKVPLRRMGKPDEMAGGVVFLLSDAATYVTGHNLMVDGGWTAI
jgi:NAD(P)-dependent dehydrogenase (short-subunit alcohol dehydrogenase family)